MNKNYKCVYSIDCHPIEVKPFRSEPYIIHAKDRFDVIGKSLLIADGQYGVHRIDLGSLIPVDDEPVTIVGYEGGGAYSVKAIKQKNQFLIYGYGDKAYNTFWKADLSATILIKDSHDTPDTLQHIISTDGELYASWLEAHNSAFICGVGDVLDIQHTFAEIKLDDDTLDYQLLFLEGDYLLLALGEGYLKITNIYNNKTSKIIKIDDDIKAMCVTACGDVYLVGQQYVTLNKVVFDRASRLITGLTCIAKTRRPSRTTERICQTGLVAQNKSGNQLIVNVEEESPEIYHITEDKSAMVYLHDVDINAVCKYAGEKVLVAMDYSGKKLSVLERI